MEDTAELCCCLGRLAHSKALWKQRAHKLPLCLMRALRLPASIWLPQGKGCVQAMVTHQCRSLYPLVPPTMHSPAGRAKPGRGTAQPIQTQTIACDMANSQAGTALTRHRPLRPSPEVRNKCEPRFPPHAHHDDLPPPPPPSSHYKHTRVATRPRNLYTPLMIRRDSPRLPSKEVRAGAS
jgi:hypothetical protein